MDVRYGTFPRGLAIVSGIIAFYLAFISLISHPLGFAGSAIILYFWGLFLKLIAFGFEPNKFRVLREPEKSKKSLPDFIDPNQAPDVSKIVESVTKPKAKRNNRILGAAGQIPTVRDRTLGQVHQNHDLEAEAREEDKAWAEMFRAL